MTAATYTTNLVNIVNDTQTASATNWTALGGGPAGLNPASTENFIQGSHAMSKDAFGSTRRGFIYNTGSDQGGSGTDGAYSFWTTFTSPPSLDTKAGAGLDVLIGSSASAYEHYHIAGSDTFPFGGWVFAAVNENAAGDETTGTPTAGVEQTFGVLADATAAGSPAKGETLALDTVREGRHDIVIEFGTGADPEATFDGVMTNLETATNRYGMMAQREPGGAFEASGLIQFGTSTNAVEFTDADKVFFLRDHDHVTANFHTWEANNASSIVTFTNLVVKALGTTSPGRWITNNNATLNWTTCQWIDMGVFSFDTNSTIDTCTFNGCDYIDAQGADLSGSSFLVSSAANDEGAVRWAETLSDPRIISELDDCVFEQGANSHHAIAFGTGVDEDITLTGITFNGFSSSDDADGSTLAFLATTGTMNCNLVDCTVDGVPASLTNVGIDDAAGITVTLVISPITTKVTIEEADGTAIENARVFLEVADAGPATPEISYISEAISGSTSAAPSLTHGLTFLEGDLILVSIGTNGSATCSDNNGADALTQDHTELFNSNGSRVTIFSRIATASEPATFNFTLGSSTQNVIHMRQYRGVDSSIYDVTPASQGLSTGSGSSLSAATMTTTEDYAKGIFIGAVDAGSGTLSTPTNGYANLTDDGTGSGVECMADKEIVSLGAVGATGCTFSSTGAWAAIQFALAPAPVTAGLPYQGAVTTLTQSSGTATLTSTQNHNLATGDKVVVRGATNQGYNRTASITVTGDKVFTYTVPTAEPSPAGGTPVFSYCPLSGLTDASGVISSQKAWPVSQALSGWARKSTSSPYFKQSAISVADASNGTDLLIALQPDE